MNFLNLIKTRYSNKNHLFSCLNIKTKRKDNKDSSIDNSLSNQNYKKIKMQNTTFDKKDFEINLKLMQKNKKK